MKKIQGINDFSKELLATVPPLKPGKSVQYRLASIKPDPLNPGRILCPSYMGLPTKERIYDPYAEQWIEIGVIRDIVTETDRSGKLVERVLWDEVAFEAANYGIITLHGELPGHEEKHIRLWLSNYNLDNPNRIETFGDCLFNFVDPVKKADENTKLRNLKLDALLAIREMSDDDIMAHAISLGADPNADFKVMLDRLQLEADTNPARFLETSRNSNDATIKSALVKAQQSGVIKFDLNEWAYKWGSTDEIITSDIRRESKDKLQSLTAWIKSSKHGPSIFEEIVKAVKEVEAKKKTSKKK